jgi:hypothetical protein
MKLVIGTFLAFLVCAQSCQAQVSLSPSPNNAEALAPAPELRAESYAVIGATPEQESALREQIRLMHPPVLPSRVIFVPRWKYQDAARTFRLHVPTDMSSVMFTHLASRTVFINNDRYLGEDWLAHWMAHELGHLATNSTKEQDAEKAAGEFRRRLKDHRKTNVL